MAASDIRPTPQQSFAVDTRLTHTTPTAPTDSRPTDMQKHSVTVAGHRTSISLERVFWDAIQLIARKKGVSLNRLIAQIDAARTDHQTGNLSSAIRVFVLEHRIMLD